MRANRVLLVEDNPVDALILRRFIEVLPGWSVAHASSLQSARELCTAEAAPGFDLVAVDLTLPDAHGLEVVAFAREQLPDAVCVVITGESDLTTAMDALRHGASDYLVKGEGLREHFVQRALQLATLRRDIVRQTEASERNMRGVLSAMADALFVLDADHRVVFRNPPAERLQVRFREDEEGPGPIVHAVAGESILTTVGRMGGPDVPVLIQTSPIRWGDAEAGLVVLRDLSADRAAQDLRERASRVEKLAEVGEVAYKDWHDVRKKLGAIDDALEKLERLEAAGDEDTAASERLVPLRTLRSLQSDLMRSAEKYRRDFLSLSNVRIPVDIATVVRSNCSNFEGRIQHHADLTLKLGETPTVLADDVQLGNAIINLLDNAVQAIKPTGRRGNIRVSTETHDGWVAVEVADDGPGFPPGVLDQGLQVGTSHTRGGTGLGLTRVQQTVRDHGGTLDVVSIPGSGAKITLRLRVAQTVPTRRGRRILFVDDDPMAVYAAKRALGRSYDVQSAADGVDAMELLQEDPHFDVIFCDLEMPRLDGPGLYRALVQEHPKLVRRLVFCSGGASTPEMLEFLQQSSTHLLFKPLDEKTAVAMIEQIVANEGPAPRNGRSQAGRRAR